jgi:hypothetical protein
MTSLPNHRFPSGLLRFVPLLVTAILVLQACGQPACGAPLSEQERREGVRWPGEGGRRINVSIAIVVIDFARVNLREESFAMAGYLDVTWFDPKNLQPMITVSLSILPSLVTLTYAVDFSLPKVPKWSAESSLSTPGTP